MSEDDATRFWRHAVALYGAPGVKAACLALQDEHGADVNLLLYGAYAGAVMGRRLDDAAWRTLVAGTEVWRTEIVQAVRAVRRRAKALTAAAPELGFVYESLQRTELDAERAEHAMLIALDDASAPAEGGDPASLAAANMRACLVAQGIDTDDPAVAAALERISRLAAAVPIDTTARG